MTDDTTPDRKAPPTAPRSETDRIAKVMARAGIASRREAERMIVEGRVSVNGKKIDSPALDVLPTDRITVDGKKLDEPQETRLWLYYKPLGLITSESDEKGRQTVFDALPRDLPRVMTVGRLDLNSEGLLLLTNDGELKRRLELPSTGWLRRYRVRVNGTPSDMTFDPLRRGVTIEGEDFAPMEIKLDSQQGANAWLTVGIREGKNREIRRAMAHVGLQVNRLIRIGYGPFKLTGMDKNEVVEVKRKVLRDQLGGLLTGEAEDKTREMRPRGAEGARGPRREAAGDNGPRRFAAQPGTRPFGERGAGAGRDGERPARSGENKPGSRSFGERGARAGRDDERPARNWENKPRPIDDARPRFAGKPGGVRDDLADRPRTGGDKPRWKKTGSAGGRGFGGQSDDSRPSRFAGKPGEARKPYGKPRAAGEGPAKPFSRSEGSEERKPFGKRNDADSARKPFGKSRGTEGERGEKPRGGKPFGGPRSEGGRAGSGKPYGAPRAEGGGKTGGGKPFGGPRPEGGGKFQGKPRPGGGKGFDGPRGDRPAGGGKPRTPRG